jgi:hypothetical protein
MQNQLADLGETFVLKVVLANRAAFFAAALALLLTLASPYFLTSQNLINLLVDLPGK